MKRMIAIVLGGALALVGGTAAVLDAATTINLRFVRDALFGGVTEE